MMSLGLPKSCNTQNRTKITSKNILTLPLILGGDDGGLGEEVEESFDTRRKLVHFNRPCD